MPLYGLTANQRDLEPWGLKKHLLLPAKVVLDPVCGDIHVTKLEKEFIDSPPMQRLRRVKQLANVAAVYPGATHSRFLHSLVLQR
jgi:hypothetical protein